MPSPTGRRPPRRALALAALLAGLLAADAASADSTSIELSGVTLVVSRAGHRELLLRSGSASIELDTRVARLSVVSAEIAEGDGGRDLAIECERARVDLDSRSFHAEGSVRGHTGEGQLFTTDAVEYDRDSGILSSQTPVELNDAGGSLRGDGFRYHVAERRFELLGNVRVEAGP